MILLVLARLLLAGVPDAGDDDCSLNPDAIHGYLDTQDGGTRLKAVHVSERTARESIRLSDGTVVALTMGGCAHYAFSLQWSHLPPGPSPRNRHDEVLLALSLLRRTPLHDAQAVVGTLTEALEGAAQDPSARLPKSDAEISLVVSHAHKETTVELSYDFML
jgi:hypothetical protein